MSEGTMRPDELLARVARGHDRDAAPFFAGRKAEIAAFEGAVQDAKHLAQTQFRIFQGAPGCGKTSLLTHLRENAPENRVFVRVDTHHLIDHATLVTHVTRDLLRKTSSGIAKTLAWIVPESTGFAVAVGVGGDELKAAGTFAGRALQAVGGKLEAQQIQQARRESELVLTLDEAQVLDARHEDVLRSLHTNGLAELHTVFAFAGLSHTAANMGSLNGLSRPASNATVNMGLMAESECVGSTQRMLVECGIPGTAAKHAEIARRVGAMARQWPQHLACAHTALARDLIRVDKDIARVDLDAVDRNTTLARHDYYRKQLANHPVLAHAPFAARVVAAIHAQNENTTDSKRTMSLGQVVRLCRLTLEAEPDDSPVREFDVAPLDIATRLIEKGVITQASEDDPFEATIPSMSTWLAEQLPHNDPVRRNLLESPADSRPRP